MIVSLNGEKKKKDEKEQYHSAYSSHGGGIRLEPLPIGGKALLALLTCRFHQSRAIDDLKEVLSSLCLVDSPTF